MNRAIVSASRRRSGGGGGSYLVEQNFANGSGATPGAPVSGGTWSYGGSSWAFDNTTPALPDGGKNAKATDPSYSYGGMSVPVTSASELFGYLQFRMDTGSSGGRDLIILSLSGTDKTIVNLQVDKTLKMFTTTYDGQLATTVSALAADTNYHIWWHYKAGSGSNGILEISFSTSGVRPTSGNAFAQVTSSAQTSAIDKVAYQTSESTGSYYFDRILINNSAIGDNP